MHRSSRSSLRSGIALTAATALCAGGLTAVATTPVAATTDSLTLAGWSPLRPNDVVAEQVGVFAVGGSGGGCPADTDNAGTPGFGGTGWGVLAFGAPTTDRLHGRAGAQGGDCVPAGGPALGGTGFYPGGDGIASESAGYSGAGGGASSVIWLNPAGGPVGTDGQILTIGGGGGAGGGAGGTGGWAGGDGGSGAQAGNPGQPGATTTGGTAGAGGTVGTSAQSDGADAVGGPGGCDAGGDCGGGGGSGGGAGTGATPASSASGLAGSGGGGAGGQSQIDQLAMISPAASGYGTASSFGNGSVTVTWLDITGSIADVEAGADYGGDFDTDTATSYTGVNWSIDGTAPAGLTIDPATGRIGGSSAAATPGSYTFQIRALATDASGRFSAFPLRSSRTVTVEVTQVTPPPQPPSPPPPSPPADQQPGPVRDLKVAGGAKAKRYTIKWKAPASTAPVTQYRLRINQRGFGKLLLNKRVDDSVERYRVPRSRLLERSVLAKGDVQTSVRYRVRVDAINVTGSGPVRTAWILLRLR